MKWLHEKACPWGEFTFANAAKHGDINNLKWLYQNGCPWSGTAIDELRDEYFVRENILQWMQENGCPAKLDYNHFLANFL